MPEPKVTYEPVTKDEAREQIAIGVHTGLRKGSEAPDSAKLWRAISDSNDSSWSDAVRYCVNGLESMGWALCRKVEVPSKPKRIVGRKLVES